MHVTARMTNSFNRQKFMTERDMEQEKLRQTMMQPSKQMVSIEPIWKDPHEEISRMAAQREI